MAFTKGKIPLAGYPEPVGAKKLIVFDHTGPASYAAFTSPSTGGSTVTFTPGFGLNQGGVDWMSSGMLDTTGQILAYAFPTKGGNSNAVPSYTLVFYSLVTATLGGQAQTAGSQIVATTDLSTFSWRFAAVVV